MHHKQLDKLLTEQSSELLEAMKRGDKNDRRALVDWLTQSKRHVRTHLFMTALEEELKHIDPQRLIPVPEVHGRMVSTIAERGSSSASIRARFARPWTWAAAAGVMIAIAVTATFGLASGRFGGWHDFRTAVGEQRAVQLEDGSIVQLNTASRVKVRLSASSREIRLLEGEALFKVHYDTARPFRVFTGDATIRAVGTQFNVYRLTGSTKVSVLEGRVSVSVGEAAPKSPSPASSISSSTMTQPAVANSGTALLLAAGEEAQIRQDGRIDRRRSPDVANTAAWVQRRIVFKQEPLANVVMQFNRYRKSPQFRVDDAGLALRKYSGTFDVDDPKSLEDVLANERDIAMDRSGDAVVIRWRAESAAAAIPQ